MGGILCKTASYAGAVNSGVLEVPKRGRFYSWVSKRSQLSDYTNHFVSIGINISGLK